MAGTRDVYEHYDFHGNSIVNVGNFPTGGSGGSGVAPVDISHTYTAANKTFNLPPNTVKIVLFNGGGLRLSRADVTINTTVSPPTATINSGALENDVCEGEAWVSNPTTTTTTPTATSDTYVDSYTDTY